MSEKTTTPPGAAAAAAPTKPPLSFAVVLFPGFQALDVFGPLDALNLLSLSHPMTLHLLSHTLDPVSTKPSSDFAQRLLPTHTFATAPPTIDVLLVPGGHGTRQHQTPAIAQAVAYIRDVFPSLRYLITVCTGAGLAARAGVLDGRRATTNKRAWRETVALGPEVQWVHRARWVEDGNVWTSSGISAGIDVIFAWMRAVHGDDMAKDIADRMEYTPILDPDDDPFADRWPESK